jgi:MFS family permease
MTSRPPAGAPSEGGPDALSDGQVADGQLSEPSRAAKPSGLRRFVLDTEPLTIRPYRRLWTSTIVTAVGSQLTAVAVPKQIYDVTGSSAYVGLSGLVALVPLIVFALWGGAIADAVDRRTLLMVTNGGLAVTSFLLWAQAAMGNRHIWEVLALLALQQAFFGMNSPTRSASVARLVPLRMLPAANALNATVMQIGSIAGPLLAGVLIPVLGISALYLIDSFALLAAFGAVYRLPPLPPLDGVRRRAGLREVVDGFRYLSLHKILLVSFLADIIAMVFGMPRALFPQLASETFGGPGGGGLALGVLFAAIPVGSLLAGLLSGTFTRVRRHGVAVAVSVAAWGAGIVGFGLSRSLLLAALFLAVAGAADLASMVFRSSILQEAATDEMRGRMQGVFTVVVAGGPRLADLVHGLAGAAFGTAVTITAGGVLVILAMAAAVLAFPAFWRYRAPD